MALKTTQEFYGGRLPQLFAQLNREFHNTDSAAELAIEGLALGIMAEEARQSSTGPSRTTPSWLRHTREMVFEHFLTPLTLAQIAAEVGVHPVHLATAFRQQFGAPLASASDKCELTGLAATSREIFHLP